VATRTKDAPGIGRARPLDGDRAPGIHHPDAERIEHTSDPKSAAFDEYAALLLADELDSQRATRLGQLVTTLFAPESIPCNSCGALVRIPRMDALLEIHKAKLAEREKQFALADAGEIEIKAAEQRLAAATEKRDQVAEKGGFIQPHDDLVSRLTFSLSNARDSQYRKRIATIVAAVSPLRPLFDAHDRLRAAAD